MAINRIPVMCDLNGFWDIKIENHSAEYDSKTQILTGFGIFRSKYYKNLNFEPTFDVLVRNRRRDIVRIGSITYHGIFTKTGTAAFSFTLTQLSPEQVSSVLLLLIAKLDDRSGNNLKKSPNDIRSES